MDQRCRPATVVFGLVFVAAATAIGAQAQASPPQSDPSKSSYMPVVEENFQAVFARMSAE